jgi:peptide/nickel transport system substrate-binding protein
MVDAWTRREALRNTGAAAALLTLPAALAACGSGGDGAATGSGRSNGVEGEGTDATIPSFTWAVNAAIPTLDIATGFFEPGIQVMSLGLEGLVSVDSEFAVQPRLAASWSQPDPLHYVYKIRPGVQFWDGTPLTAEDVVWSMARHADPKVASQIATYYGRVKSIEATAADEVTIALTEPDPAFQYVPAWSFVTPKGYSERLGSKLGVAGGQVNTMGTGPYRITKFDSDTGATLMHNEGYWGEKARIEQVKVEVIPDPNNLRLAIQAGEIEGSTGLSLGSLRDFERISTIGLDFPPPLTVYFLAFDVTREPWSDVHARRALAHAADLQGYAKAFLGDAGIPAQALPSIAQWSDLAPPARVKEIYAQIPQYPYDLEAAKDELAQSSTPGGFSTTIQYPSGESELGRALVSLSESLKGIGIELDVKEVPAAKWLADVYAHSQPATAVSLNPTTPDPTNYMMLVYPSANAAKNNFNFANYKNPQVDRLLREQAKETDKEKRASLIGEVLKISGEDLPYLPLWWQAVPLALHKKYVYEGFEQLFYLQDWLANVKARA